MRRSTIFLLAGSAILLLAVLGTELLIPLSGVPGAVVDSPEEPVIVSDVFRHNEVGQGFRATRDGLCRIDLRLRPVLGACHVVFRLRSEGGAWEGHIPCPAEETAWYTIRFPRLPHSAGETYHWTVRLTDPDSGAVAGVVATAENVVPGSTLVINGQTTAVDAVFTPHYCTYGGVGRLALAWANQRRLDLTAWLAQEHDVVTPRGLLWAVGAMAVLVVVLLIAPAREEPVRLRLARDLPRAERRRIGRAALAGAGLALCLGLLVAFMIQIRLVRRTAGRLVRSPASPTPPTGDVWVAYDFIANLRSPQTAVDTPEDHFIAPGWLEIATETAVDRRPALMMHPPSHVYYTVDVPPNARLHAAATMDPAVWDPEMGDGVLFIVRVVADGVEETIFYREIDPKNDPADRRWHDVDVDLSPYAEHRVTFALITYPMESNEWDWAAWGMPVILTPHSPQSPPEGP